MLLHNWLREAALRHGSTKALVYKDTYLSWRGVYERVERRARELQQLGISAGHWVGLMLGNVPEFLILAGALSKLQTLVVPVDPTTGAKELQSFLRLLPLRALITRPKGGVDPTSSAPERGKPIPPPPDGIQPDARKRLQGTLLSCALYKRPLQIPTPSDAEFLFISSDEEGEPLGVFRTATQEAAQQEAWKQALSLDTNDRLLALIPLHTTYGFEQGLLTAAALGMTLYLEDELTGTRIVKLAREQDISLVIGTPRLFSTMARSLVTPVSLAKQRIRFVSSEYAVPEEDSRLFRERLFVPLHSLYRHTEAGLVTLDPQGNDTASGLALPGVGLRCEGRAPDTAAPVWVRSAWTCTHTLRREGVHMQQTDSPSIGERTPEGWLRTGDTGWLTPEGTLRLVGREDDRVKLEHKRVAQREVVRCLEQHPRVRSARIEVTRTVDDQVTLTATVRCGGACSEEELLDYCVTQLAPYKIPRRIVVVDETATR